MENKKDEMLLASIAQDFYLSKLPISTISRKYNLSRYLVTKYLDEALARGIVDINIHTGYARNAQLEKRLSQSLPIKRLFVLKDPGTPAARQSMVANFAAYQLQAAIRQAHVVGLTWGETVFDVLNAFSPQDGASDLVFTQFVGENMKYHSSSGSMRMVQKAASSYDAAYYTIPGPLYVLNDQVRKGLIKEPPLAAAFNYAAKMDLILSALGTLESIDSIQPWHANKAAILQGVDPKQVAGMAFARPFDINGNFLIDERHSKALSLPLDQILRVPRRFGVVQQKGKVKAALGALRGGFFTDIIITEALAIRIDRML